MIWYPFCMLFKMLVSEVCQDLPVPRDLKDHQEALED